jgi:YVTN family beta-propeller protein
MNNAGKAILVASIVVGIVVSGAGLLTDASSGGPSGSPGSSFSTDLSIVGTATTGSGPLWSSVNTNDHDVFVSNAGTSTVTALSGTSVAATIPVGTNPEASSYNFGNHDIYVPNSGSHNISVIGGTSIAGTVPVGNDPIWTVYDGTSGYIFTINQASSNMTVISGTSITNTLTLSYSSAISAAYDSTNGDIYVTNSASTIRQFSDTGLPVALIGVGTTPFSVVFDSINNDIYVDNVGSQNVTVISGSTTVGNIKVGGTPGYMAVDTADNYVYVPNSGTNNVSVISGTSRIATIPVGNEPGSVAWNGVSDIAYVANYGSHNVSAICGTTRCGTIETGTAPENPTYDSINGYVYVQNAGSNNETIISGAPATPYGVTAGSASTSSIALTWTNVPYESSTLTASEVYYATYLSSCGSYSALVAGSAPYDSATATGLSPGSAYCFEVTVSNSTGASLDSAPLVDVVTITNAPTGLTQGVTTTNSVVLSWTAPATSPATGVITSYDVLQASYSGSCGGYVSTSTGSTSTTYTVTGLSSNAAYCFEVEAVDSAGHSVASSPLTAVYTTPGTPTGLSGTGQYTTMVVWSWTNPAGTLTDDYLFWEAGASCSAATRVDIGSVVTTYTLGSLSGAIEYCAYVEAVGSGGASAASGTATAWTYPSVPTGLSYTVIGTTSLVIVWTNPSGSLTDNHVYESRDLGSSCGVGSGTNLGSVETSHTVTGLLPQQIYCFEVTASSQAGEGNESSPLIIGTTPEPGTPSPPTDLHVYRQGATWAYENWTNPSAKQNITGNVVLLGSYLAGNCVGYVVENPGAVAVLSGYNLTSLSPGSSYCSAVTAFNSTGNSSVSVPVFIILTSTTVQTPTTITLFLGNITGTGNNRYVASTIWYDNYPTVFSGTIYLTGSWFATAMNVTVYLNGAPVYSYDGGSQEVVAPNQINATNGSAVSVQATYTGAPTFSTTSPLFFLNGYEWTIPFLIILAGLVLAVLVGFIHVSSRSRNLIGSVAGILLIAGLVGVWFAI